VCRLSDLVNLNPGASSLRPGASVEVPCYPPEEPFKFGYYGGDVAFGLVRRVLAALPACLPGWLATVLVLAGKMARQAGWLVGVDDAPKALPGCSAGFC
jgi:hypothetical protein